MNGQERDKNMFLLLHDENRIDLSIEKDGGNQIIILMGKGKVNWEGLKRLCETALKLLTD